MALEPSATLAVNLADRSYPIAFGRSARELVGSQLASLRQARRRFAVVTDENVAQAQPALLQAFESAPIFAAKPGEAAKSPEVLTQVWSFLARERIDRTGAVFAVGGGVVGDLAGFAAASWLRGVDCYQVPTTLLAMVDSSVGGKTGINIAAGKNLVGAFHQPRAVFIATDLLATLPPREFAAGAAEIVKYGLLADAALFDRLERQPLTPGSADLSAVIRRCCELKAEVVQADERELAKEGGRALLNLGHTFGHAIEQATGYGAYLHGEAVAIGLCAAARLSEKLGYVGLRDVQRVDAVVAAHALPTRLRAPLSLNDLLSAMARDKKVRAGLPRFVVLKRVGQAITQDDVPLELAEASFREVGAV